MTILLIFFIFIYTQSAGQINSISQMRSPIQEQTSVLQIRKQPPQELTAEIPIERRQILPSVSINAPEAISAQAPQLSERLNTEGMAESIEQIREDALKSHG